MDLIILKAKIHNNGDALADDILAVYMLRGRNYDGKTKRLGIPKTRTVKSLAKQRQTMSRLHRDPVNLH